MGHLQANVAAAKAVIRRVVAQIPLTPNWPEHRSLDGAIMTPRSLWPEAQVTALGKILERLA